MGSPRTPSVRSFQGKLREDGAVVGAGRRAAVAANRAPVRAVPDVIDAQQRRVAGIGVAPAPAPLSPGVRETCGQPGMDEAQGRGVDDLVERLMGRNADQRFQFIQENAEFTVDLDV